MNWVRLFAIPTSLVAASFACTVPESAPEPQPTVAAQSTQEAESTAASPSVELEQIHARLEAVKAQLFEEGEYNCCIEPSCNWCALHEGSCNCFTNLQAGEEVCPGCGLGWHNGHGIVEGVDADDVEWNITHEHPGGGHEH